MKRIATTLLAAMALATAANAQQQTEAATAQQPEQQQAQQQIKYGYFSYDSVMHNIPDYAIATNNLRDLKMKYENEMKRAEDEFNAKYEEFLDGQRDFVPSILKKRQAELQDIMDKNTKFKSEARRLLKQAEEQAYAPLREKLQKAVATVGRERGYAFILNTDGNACPYTDPAMGQDITTLLIDMFGK